MLQPATPQYIETAFADGFIYTDNDKNVYHFYTKHIGDINIVEGRIIACDPFLYNDHPAFDTLFPVGSFPVQLAIAGINTDERIAYARIAFSSQKPVSWKMATMAGQDVETLATDEIFGYGVDAGTGSFMDTSGAREFSTFMMEDENNFEELIEQMNSNSYQHTRSWLLWARNNVNAAMFSSGWGDGFYASYIGYDASTKICRLVTDFGVI